MKLEDLIEKDSKQFRPETINKDLKTNSKSSVEQLMEICEAYNYFTDETGVQFAEIIDPLGNKTITEIKSSDFKNNLRVIYYEITKRVPSKTDLEGAIEMMAYKGKVSSDTEQVFLRFGKSGDKHFVDMNNDNGDVIEITRNQWSITNNKNIRFKRTSQQKTLFKPERTSAKDLKLLLKYLRLKNDKHKMLVLATVCSFVMSDIVRPILCFVGPKGSGKSTNVRIIRTLLDPREPLFNNTVKHEKEMSILFSQNALPCIDNMSDMSRNMSDIFCKTVTGSGFESRTLYTDTDLTHMIYRRGMLMTALDLPSTMPDFLSRCVHITLDEMGDEAVSEKQLMEEFEADKPKIFGGLLQTIAHAKSHIEWMKFNKLPRLADYAMFGAAVCDVLGYDPNEFMKALFLNVDLDKQNVSHANDPIVEMICDYMKETDEYEGTTSQLLASLKKMFQKNMSNMTAEGLGKKLKKLADYLKLKGIDIKFDRKNSGTVITITKLDLNYYLKSNYDCKFVEREYSDERNPSSIDYSSENPFE